jgi:hypothetical protein
MKARKIPTSKDAIWTPHCKQYVGFEHLHYTDQREVWWGACAKENMAYKVKKTLTKGVKGIVKDHLIVLKNPKHKGMLLRRVEAHVEIEGEERLMVLSPTT